MAGWAVIVLGRMRWQSRPQAAAASLFVTLLDLAAERSEVFMNTTAGDDQRWSTASSDHTADTSPMELSALGEHLDRCKGSRGRLFALRSFADTLNGLVAARFVTALVVVLLLIALMLAGSLAL